MSAGLEHTPKSWSRDRVTGSDEKGQTTKARRSTKDTKPNWDHPQISPITRIRFETAGGEARCDVDGCEAPNGSEAGLRPAIATVTTIGEIGVICGSDLSPSRSDMPKPIVGR